MSCIQEKAVHGLGGMQCLPNSGALFSKEFKQEPVLQSVKKATQKWARLAGVTYLTLFRNVKGIGNKYRVQSGLAFGDWMTAIWVHGSPGTSPSTALLLVSYMTPLGII